MSKRPLPERLVTGALRALAVLPPPLTGPLGAGFGGLAYGLAVTPRRVARANIRACFPQLDAKARERLLVRHFQTMGQSALAIARLWWASPEEFASRVRFRERGPYDEALRDKRNIILLAPHFLGLEVAGLRVSLERPAISMYQKPASALAGVLLARRQRFGGVLWRNDESLRTLVRAVRSGKPFYYLPDLDPGEADSVVAPFFGLPTPTLTSLSRLARLTDAVVLPCLTRTLAGGAGFEITIRPALTPFPTADPVADAALMNAAIEAGVRAAPEDYLWTYRRFKRVVTGGRPFYD